MHMLQHIVSTYVYTFVHNTYTYAHTYIHKYIYTYVTGFVKTVPNRTFSILRNTVLKYCNDCVSLVLHYSHARLAV